MLVPLSPPPGLNSDDTTFAAEGRWADGNHVRFVNGKPQTRGGAAELFTLAVTESVCRSILPFNRSGSLSIAYGVTHWTPGFGTAKLFVGAGLAAPSDRTPSGLAGDIFNWSLAPWGDTLLASPEGGTLYEQTGASAAVSVAGAPAEITHMLVTPQRQVLALGCSEETSGDFNALCIRGCDLENYSDWTSTPSNNAFEHILDGGGKIIAGRVVGSYVAIWTTSALYLGQFIGDPGQVWRFDKIADNCALVGPNAVVVFNQAAYWMGSDLRPRSWTLGGLPQIMPCPIWREFSSQIFLESARYIYASANARFNEVRFDFRDGRGGLPLGQIENRFISVCLHDGSWHRGQAGYTAILDGADISTLTTGYDDGPTIIAAAGVTFGGNTTAIALLDTGPFNTLASPASTPYIQSADFYLDNSRRRAMVRGCTPDFEEQVGTAALTLCVRDRPQSTVISKGPYTLPTGTAKKDFRASGKLFSVRFGGQEAASGLFSFRLGKPLFDVVPLGER